MGIPSPFSPYPLETMVGDQTISHWDHRTGLQLVCERGMGLYESSPGHTGNIMDVYPDL